jgi:nitric oxide synthase oxygenase domain/subunit
MTLWDMFFDVGLLTVFVSDEDMVCVCCLSGWYFIGEVGVKQWDEETRYGYLFMLVEWKQFIAEKEER